MAELGFVGDGANSYQLWLGGSPNQTRLAEAFQDRVKMQARPFFYRLASAVILIYKHNGENASFLRAST